MAYIAYLRKNYTRSFNLRKIKHTHHPVDDVTVNAEALLTTKKEHSLKIKL